MVKQVFLNAEDWVRPESSWPEYAWEDPRAGMADWTLHHRSLERPYGDEEADPPEEIWDLLPAGEDD